MPDAVAPDLALPPARRPFAAPLLAGLVLAISLTLVGWAWHVARERALREAEAEFRAANLQSADAIRERMLAVDLLVAGVAQLEASDGKDAPMRRERLTAALDPAARLPDVTAFGFAIRAPADGAGAMDASAATLPTFADFDARAQGIARVVYAAPASATNRALVGSDLSSDLRRRQAMEQAAVTGKARLTLPVPALGRSGGTTTPGALDLYAPVYARGAGPGARDDLRGWAFAQVSLRALLDPVLQARARGGSVAIDDTTDAMLVPVYRGRDADGAQGDDAPPAFVQHIPLELPGRRWRLEFGAAPRAQLERAIPGLGSMLVAGTAVSLLLSAMVLVLVRTQSRTRRLAEELGNSWRRSEQRFRSATEHSSVGNALLDRGGRVLYANPAFAALLRTTRESLVGSLFGEHFADDESVRTMEHNLLSGSAYRTVRRLRRSDGDVRHASLAFASVPGEGDDEMASLVQVEDVTERLRSEAQVLSLNRTLEARVALRTRELSRANRELEAFAASVSHDLRAPLRSIDGFARLLHERYRDVLDAGGRDHLERIRAAATRMGELIDGLLRLAEAARGELAREPVDLGALAREVASTLQAADPVHRVELRVTPGLDADADPDLLRAVLEELLANAWKATRARADARIEVDGEGDAFVVRDNGIGFPADDARRLFQPFQRLHGDDAFPGHGIGLATVKRIVERHGGSVSAEGEAGKGATFRFSLPRRE